MNKLLLELILDYLACGLDSDTTTLARYSPRLPDHSRLLVSIFDADFASAQGDRGWSILSARSSCQPKTMMSECARNLSLFLKICRALACGIETTFHHRRESELIITPSHI